MKRIFLFFTAIFFLTAVTCQATPPSEITLSYDIKTAILHVEVKHVTSRLAKHYIRTIIIYRNGQEESRFAFPTQTSPTALVKDIPYTAVSKDVITVKALCSEGGQKEASIVVPE